MPIVTDGLVGYWNSKQGVSGSVWENIAPSTLGTINGAITGAVAQTDGMYFDGVDDVISFNTTLGLIENYTIEAWVKLRTVPKTYGAIVSGDALPSMLLYDKTASDFRFYAGGYKSTANLYPTDNLYHVVVVVSNSERKINIYVNGILDSIHTTIANVTWNFPVWSIGRRIGSTLYNFNGHVSVVRFYNRILTPSEILQNNVINTEVGLTADTPSSPPVVSYLSTNKTKISDEVDINQSIITVQFDTAVTEYVAKLNGTNYSTGTLVHQGGAVSANTNAQVIIDWNELTTEGANRINIYGKGLDGQWTPYSPN